MSARLFGDFLDPTSRDYKSLNGWGGGECSFCEGSGNWGGGDPPLIFFFSPLPCILQNENASATSGGHGMTLSRGGCPSRRKLQCAVPPPGPGARPGPEPSPGPGPLRIRTTARTHDEKPKRNVPYRDTDPRETCHTVILSQPLTYRDVHAGQAQPCGNRGADVQRVHSACHGNI